MRIALAKLFLRHPDLLLLDEPTNHLDLESVQWLRGFIANYDGAVLIVSHDRAFMDACVDHVAALENRRVTTYTGNYSSYLKQREDNLEQMRAKRAAQERDIAHMQVFVDKFRYKPTKAAQAQEELGEIQGQRQDILDKARQEAENILSDAQAQAGKLAGYYADWMKNQGGSGNSGSDAQIGNRHGDSWIYIPGHGRFTYDEVENYVNSGKVIETYDSATNTYTYKWNGNKK